MVEYDHTVMCSTLASHTCITCSRTVDLARCVATCTFFLREVRHDGEIVCWNDLQSNV